MNQVTLSTDQISKLIANVFPNAQVVSCEHFAGSHTNLNYDVRVTTLMSGVVLKVYLSVSAQRAQKETRLLQMLTSETGVPVPRVLHFDDAGDEIPHPWALHSRLPGQPLSEIINALDDWELEAIGYEMGRYLAHIHEIPVDEFGEPFVVVPQNHESEKGYVLAQVRQWLQACEQETLLPIKVAEALDQIFTRTRLLNRRQACLIHGDHCAANVIVERSTTGYHVTGFLEFDQAQGGAPELDMSKLFTWDVVTLPTLQKGFLDGYAESGQISAQFWERLQLYQAFTCLKHIPIARQQERFELENDCRAWIVEHIDQLEE